MLSLTMLLWLVSAIPRNEHTIPVNCQRCQQVPVTQQKEQLHGDS